MKPVALTIAGSDPSGGAGLQADLKTFHQHGVYGAAVVTLLTVQNTCGVTAIDVVAEDFVARQIDAVLDDIPPQAAKTGALGSAAVIELVAERARGFQFPLVVDPVIVSKHGARLMDGDARKVLAERLLPRASLVTPNLHEVEVLTGARVQDLAGAREAARAIASLGCGRVVVKGLRRREQSLDLLFDGHEFTEVTGPFVNTRRTHGSGCTFSAAITAELAKGNDLVDAVRMAKAYVTRALESAPDLGAGVGPLDHHAPPGF